MNLSLHPLLAGLLLWGIALLPSHARGQNVIPNPGFEDADPAHPENPAGWMRTDWGNPVRFERTDKEAHGGRWSVMIKAGEEAHGQAEEACWATPHENYEVRIKVIPGHIYAASIFIKRANPEDTALFWIVGFDRKIKNLEGIDKDLILTSDDFTDHGPAGQWNHLTGLVHVPRDVDSISVRGRVKARGPVWFDDLSFVDQAPSGVAHLIDAASAWVGPASQPRQAVGVKLINTSPARQKAEVSADTEALGDRAQITVDLAPGEKKKIYLGLDNKRKLAAGAVVDLPILIKFDGGEVKETFRLTVAAAPTPAELEKTLLMPHFHVDPYWNKNQDEFTEQSMDVARAMLEAMRQDGDYNGVLSEWCYLDPLYLFYPQYREDLRQYFAQGRLEGSGQVCEPNPRDTMLEPLIRNILLGKIFHEDVLGGRATVSMMLDNFGQIAQWPQLLAKAGFTGCIWGRGNPYEEYAWPGLPRTARWLGLDGSMVIVNRDGYWKYVDMPLRDALGTIKKDNQGKLAKGYENITFGTVGCDWSYPTPPITEYARDFRAGVDDLLSPTVSVNGPRDYFRWITEQERRQPERPLPLVSRDMTLYHMGSTVSRPDLSIGERLAEVETVEAEKWATIANMLGAPYPDLALDKAWRKTLWVQDHASHVSSDGSFYNVLMALRDALELGRGVLRGALARICANIKTDGAGLPLVVFNGLSWTRNDVCETAIAFPEGRRAAAFRLVDETGQAVACETLDPVRDAAGNLEQCRVRFVAREVPSVGYRTYYAVTASDGAPAETPARENAENNIENEFFKVTVDPARGGGIVSLIDKNTGRELLDTAAGQVGNEIIGLLETGCSPFDLTTLDVCTVRGKDCPATVRRVASAVGETLIVTGSYSALGRITQEITLSHGVRRIDCQTRLDAPPNLDYLYLVSFPSAIQGAVGVFDEKAGAIARDASPTSYVYKTGWHVNEGGLFSCNNWIDKNYTVLLSFVDANKNEQASCALGTCEIRFPDGDPAFCALADELQQALVRKGVTCSPAYDDDKTTDDVKYRQYRIILGLLDQPGAARALYQAQDDAGRAAADRQLAEQGWCALLTRDPNATVAIDAKALLIGARDAAGLARAVRPLAAQISAEAVLQLPADGNRCLGQARVDRYGLALINVGRPGCSLEKNGALCLPLTYASDFYGSQLKDFHAFPEDKRQAFQYSLYPHAGSWREAGTARAGWERNVPLVALQKEGRESGALPARLSFFALDSTQGNVLLSALKPRQAGPGAFQAHRSDVRDGLVVRLMETQGETNSPVTMKWFAGLAQIAPATLLEKSDGPPLARGDGNTFTGALGANAIETYVADLAPAVPVDESLAYDRTAEAEGAVYARFWKHNDAEFGLGNGLLVPVLQGRLDASTTGTTATLTAWVVNSYRDKTATGQARLSSPAGWRVSPEVIDYTLSPGASVKREVTVNVPPGGPAGWLKLRLNDGKIELEDTIKCGEPARLAARCEKTVSGFQVTLANPGGQALEGTVGAAAPVDAWGHELTRGLATADLQPAAQGFRLDARTSATCEFTLRDASGRVAAPGAVEDYIRNYWTVFKVSCNGENQYLPAPRLARADRADYAARVKAGESLTKLFAWQARSVDGMVILTIAPGRCETACTTFKPVLDPNYEFSGEAAAFAGPLALKVTQGRGTVKLLQQPDASNHYEAIVMINDKDPAAAPYAIELYGTSPTGQAKTQ